MCLAENHHWFALEDLPIFIPVLSIVALEIKSLAQYIVLKVQPGVIHERRARSRPEYGRCTENRCCYTLVLQERKLRFKEVNLIGLIYFPYIRI